MVVVLGVDGVVMMSLSSSSVVDRLALRTFFIDRFLIMFSACFLFGGRLNGVKCFCCFLVMLAFIWFNL